MSKDLVDSRAMRDCCGRFATGVTVVTTRSAEGEHGMTVSAFMSVSLKPPLVCICVDHNARMLPKIRSVGRYAVNVLTEQMSAHALHFAGRPDQSLSDLFEERDGLPVLRGASATMIVELVQEVPAGDHSLLIGEVTELSHDPDALPLLWHGSQFGSIQT